MPFILSSLPPPNQDAAGGLEEKKKSKKPTSASKSKAASAVAEPAASEPEAAGADSAGLAASASAPASFPPYPVALRVRHEVPDMQAAVSIHLSPDGQWLAVAEGDAIAVLQVQELPPRLGMPVAQMPSSPALPNTYMEARAMERKMSSFASDVRSNHALPLVAWHGSTRLSVAWRGHNQVVVLPVPAGRNRVWTLSSAIQSCAARGRLLATGLLSGSLIVWDVCRGCEVHIFALGAEPVTTLHLLTSSDDMDSGGAEAGLSSESVTSMSVVGSGDPALAPPKLVRLMANSTLVTLDGAQSTLGGNRRLQRRVVVLPEAVGDPENICAPTRQGVVVVHREGGGVRAFDGAEGSEQAVSLAGGVEGGEVVALAALDGDEGGRRFFALQEVCEAAGSPDEDPTAAAASDTQAPSPTLEQSTYKFCILTVG